MLGHVVTLLCIMVGIVALMTLYVIAVIIRALMMSSRKKTPLPPTTTSTGGLKQYLPSADWLKRPGAWCKNDLGMIVLCLLVVDCLGLWMWPELFHDWKFLIRVHLAFALFAWSSQIKSKPPRWGFFIAGVAIILWAIGHHRDPNWDGTPTAPTVWISSASAEKSAPAWVITFYYDGMKEHPRLSHTWKITSGPDVTSDSMSLTYYNADSDTNARLNMVKKGEQWSGEWESSGSRGTMALKQDSPTAWTGTWGGTFPREISYAGKVMISRK